MDRIAHAARAAALLVLVAAWPLAGVADEAPGTPEWDLLERDDTPGEAYELWARKPVDSDWREFRLIGDVEAPPAVAVEIAMELAADESRVMEGQSRRNISSSEDSLVSYSIIELPMVSDRDVTTRIERQHDPENGVYRMVWREANDEGPPQAEGVVRMQRARGYWAFEPLAGERTRVVYVSHADLGGSLPAWLINPLMSSSIKANIVDLRAAVAKRGG